MGASLAPSLLREHLEQGDADRTSRVQTEEQRVLSVQYHCTEQSSIMYFISIFFFFKDFNIT